MPARPAPQPRPEPRAERRIAASPRPLAGAAMLRRAREARAERLVLAAALLLGLGASGFAGYVIAGQERPYAVQAVVPAGTGPFAWKRPPGPAGPRPAVVDLDPTTTGAIPARSAAAPAPAEPAPESGYSLRAVGGGLAVLEGAGGRVTVATGGEVPGAGRVLAIRNTGAGWVVITTQTIIGPAQL